MEDIKYFGAQIEDIRVGYECETYATFFNVDMNVQRQEWTKLQLIPNAVKSIISKDVPIDKVKTPYLTKKQIEAEGWKFDYGLMDHMFFSKECAALVWFGRSNSIEVQQPANLVVYNGHCPSINEFRYITKKLLNI